MATEMLATARSRRANAGSKMARLLNEEEDEKDEFYDTVYDGGFKEESDEEDYEPSRREEKEQADVVDSDFDIDEDAEGEEEEGDGEEGVRRKRRVVTKAYKEPLAKRKAPLQVKRSREESDEEVTSKKKQKTGEDEAKPRRGRKRRIRYASGSEDSDFPDYEPIAYEPQASTSTTAAKRSAEEEIRELQRIARLSIDTKLVRSSTKLKSQETEERFKKRTKEEAKRREEYFARKVEYEMPTQEELMEETKITEMLNMESLAKFHQMELEKKKARPVKAAPLGPRIRYHSVAMPQLRPSPSPRPLIEMIEDGQEEKEEAAAAEFDPSIGRRGVHERTFISFSDESVLKQVFEKIREKPKEREARYCALTKLRTPYFDPATKSGYYNRDVFKILRAAYNRVVYRKGDRRNPVVRRYCVWLEKAFPDVYNKERMEDKWPPGNTFYKKIEKIVQEEAAMEASVQGQEGAEDNNEGGRVSDTSTDTLDRASTISGSEASESPQKSAPSSSAASPSPILKPALAKTLIQTAKNATPVRLPAPAPVLPVKTYPAKSASGSISSTSTSAGPSTSTIVAVPPPSFPPPPAAAGEGQPRQVLVAARKPATVTGAPATSATVAAAGIRGPIVFRASAASQFPRVVGQGTKIAVAGSPGGVVGTPLTLVNIRRDGPAVFRAGPGVNQITPNQVQQTASGATAAAASGGTPVTVRLPASAATASALVASGMRPVSRALLTSIGGTRAAPGNPAAAVVLARSPKPISSSGSPQRFPTSMRAISASQLRNVLSSGAGVQVVNARNAPPATATVAAAGVRAPVRAIAVTTRQTAPTTMASAMVRPPARALGASGATEIPKTS